LVNPANSSPADKLADPRGTELIDGGTTCNTAQRDTTLIVPLFDAPMKHILPGDDWR
jgi:hypothetical protein